MKTKTFFILLLCFINIALPAQKIDVKGKIEKQTIKRANKRTDQGINKGLDKMEEGVVSIFKGDDKEGKKDEKDTKETVDDKTSDNTSDAQSAQDVDPKIQAYSKYDFVPGENVVFYEDFMQDAIGDFPALWFTNGSGEIVTLNNYPGHWLMMRAKSDYCYMFKEPLPENYTIEFDFIRNNCVTNQNFTLFFLESVGKGKNAFASTTYPGFKMEICHEKAVSLSNSGVEAMEKVNNRMEVDELKNQCGKPVKISIWVQKQRVRIYINEVKVYDIPKLLPKDAKMDVFRFYKRIPDQSDFISNVRVAVGAPDTRNKLLTEGKYVTNGIKFDVGSDKIKPESYGVLKEIGTVLKENADVKVRIVGHTDNDGDDASNLQLSQKRAQSVKSFLNSEFGIDSARLETDGKGEKEPVSDNTTSEGKANNRRVEFIKL